MSFLRILKASTIAVGLMLVASLSCAASTPAVTNPTALQKVISGLQAQMQQIANSVPKQLAFQNVNNQKAITQLQKQTQAQINHLQSEIQQLQNQMTKELALVQKEVQQEARIK